MVDRLGKYELIRTLGHGAMGEVYLAHHPVIGREVAIKTILPTAAKGEDAEARFRREATAAGKLNHPNLVTIYDFDKDGDILYLVMEYVKGEDLEELIRERDLTQAQYLEVLAQVCDGLAYAHKSGIIHRDIKPSNVRVVRDGKRLLGKVMDFGIARTEDSGMTATGIVMGTVSYMAPEYIQSGKATVQADLWAVGVMLYECLSGRKPFHAENTTTVLFKIVSETPRPIDPSEIHGISPAVKAVLERALAKNPSERFFSAEEFAKALRACKDPSWTGAMEGGLTTVIQRQEAAQAMAEAAGVLPPTVTVPAAAPAPLPAAEPGTVALASAPTMVQAAPAAPTQAMPAAPAAPTVALAPEAPVAPTVALPTQPPAAPTVALPAAAPAGPTVALPAGAPAGPTVAIQAPAQPSVAPPPSVPAPSHHPTTPAPKAASKTGLYAGIGIAAAAVLGIGGWALFGRSKGPDAPPPPVEQVGASTSEPAQTTQPGTTTPVATTTTPEANRPEPAKTNTQPTATTPSATPTKAEPAKPEPPKPEPPKVEPPKPAAATETPEQKLQKAMAMLAADPRGAAQLLKPLTFQEPTSKDPKVHGSYLGAVYRNAHVSEFENGYKNALRQGFGAKKLVGASPEFKAAFNQEMQKLKAKQEGLITREFALVLLNDFSEGK